MTPTKSDIKKSATKALNLLLPKKIHDYSEYINRVGVYDILTNDGPDELKYTYFSIQIYITDKALKEAYQNYIDVREGYAKIEYDTMEEYAELGHRVLQEDMDAILRVNVYYHLKNILEYITPNPIFGYTYVLGTEYFS